MIITLRTTCFNDPVDAGINFYLFYILIIQLIAS